MRIQSKGYKRDRMYGFVLKEVKRRIYQLARQHNCSMAFVENTILAEALKIEIDEVFYENRINRKQTHRKTKAAA